MAGTNNFLVFNEANSQDNTMSDADYLADLYRLNGLIPMIADPLAHNKMFRQWSIMITALANIIASMNYNASDADLATLQNNLKSAIEDIAEAKVDTRITTLETWKSDITATTTEINYLTGAESNIQNQINSISGSLATPFPAWIKNTAYAVGDICICTGFNSYKYLECVVAGTSATTMPSNANVGQLITDNEIKWLVCDWRDSAPVGAFRADMVQRAGWLKANGATINRADYPRLWAYAVDNSLTTNDQTNNPGLFGTGDGSTTFILPNFEDYFVRYSYTRAVGSKQASQMAQHNHSCGNQDTSHTHTLGNQSANHKHSIGNQTVSHKHNFSVPNIVSGGGTEVKATSDNSLGRITYSGTTDTQSASHTHTLGNQDTSHTHSIGNQSANHKHSIGNTGSGSNTYPDNIAMQMYIKY